MNLRYAKLPIVSLLVLTGLGAALGELNADTRTTADYIALVFEAEDHATSDERWVLTEPGTPQQPDDPDANHSDQAVGLAYLELLPDIRVTHGDPMGPPQAYWDLPGTGPQASYPLDFPEAGRYYVHIRALSTGTEDNGIHVGLNGTWPDSGARMQFCTANTGWQWSGRQRNSGGTPCGIRKTIWVTVEEPGTNTFHISAREDGFEIDRIMLIKDLSDNTRICSPANSDDINCSNGSLENVDDVTDLDVLLDSAVMAGEIGDQFDITTTLWNRDRYDNASDVELDFDLGLGSQWELVSQDESCQAAGTNMVCALGQVSPTVPDEEHVLGFTLKALASGSLTVPVEVTTSSVDGTPGNNTDELQIVIGGPVPFAALETALNEPVSSMEPGVQVTLDASITNTGTQTAVDTVATFALPVGLSATSLSAGCSGDQTVSCLVGELAPAASADLNLGVTAAEAGMFSVSISANASNYVNDDAAASIILTVVDATVIEPVVEPVVDPVTDPVDESDTSEENPDSGMFGPLAALLLLVFLSARRRLSLRSNGRLIR